ncbi:hypothetical protein [Laceyella putida]|uniref:Uncharacterized protein n=1 Tax=Laceyella putida TaxID=110101 RepID=A0ABW2RI54_9BACL
MTNGEQKGLERMKGVQTVKPNPVPQTLLFGANSLKQAFMVKEILDRPRALRPFQRNGWFR